MHIAGSYTGPHKQQLEESTSWAWRVHESLGIGSQFMTDSSKIGSFGFMELDVWQKRGDEMEWWNMRSLICTPPKFNIAPEKWCLEDYFAIGKVTWAMLNFRVCIYIFFVFIMYIELKAEVFPASTDFLIEKQQDVKACCLLSIWSDFRKKTIQTLILVWYPPTEQRNSWPSILMLNRLPYILHPHSWWISSYLRSFHDGNDLAMKVKSLVEKLVLGHAFVKGILAPTP